MPTPTGPMEFHKSTRDLKEQSAGKEYTKEVRDGGHDPGVRRPGAPCISVPCSWIFFMCGKLFFDLRVFIKE